MSGGAGFLPSTVWLHVSLFPEINLPPIFWGRCYTNIVLGRGWTNPSSTNKWCTECMGSFTYMKGRWTMAIWVFPKIVVPRILGVPLFSPSILVVFPIFLETPIYEQGEKKMAGSIFPSDSFGASGAGDQMPGSITFLVSAFQTFQKHVINSPVEVGFVENPIIYHGL